MYFVELVAQWVLLKIFKVLSDINADPILALAASALVVEVDCALYENEEYSAFVNLRLDEGLKSSAKMCLETLD